MEQKNLMRGMQRLRAFAAGACLAGLLMQTACTDDDDREPVPAGIEQSILAGAKFFSDSSTDVVLSWHFEDNSGDTSVDDSSTYNHDGGYAYSPTTTSGRFGYGIALESGPLHTSDGDNLFVESTSDLNFGTGSFSAGMWVKVPDISDDQVLILKGRIELWAWNFGTFYANIHGATSYPRAELLSTTRYDDNNWHHVMMVRDASADLLKLYVDGNLENSTDDSSYDVSSVYPFYVGMNLDGVVDDVLVTKVALSSSQVCEVSGGTYNGTSCVRLIGSWTFNDTGDNTADDSSWGNNKGTVIGATETTGYLGSSWSFDGSGDYVRVNDADRLDFGTGSFAITTWVKTNTNAIDDLVEKITTTTGYSLQVLSNGTLQGLVAQNSYLDEYEDVVSNSTINDNTWHHIAFIRDVSEDLLKIYVDGVLDATDDNSNYDISNSSALYFGADAQTVAGTGGPYWYTGKLDEVRLYDKALSASEVCSTAGGYYSGGNCDLSGVPYCRDNLVSYWTFNSGTVSAGSFNDFMSLQQAVPGYDATQDASGATGYGAVFDGDNDYLFTDYNANYQIQRSVSVASWVKLSNASRDYYEGFVANFANDCGGQGGSYILRKIRGSGGGDQGKLSFDICADNGSYQHYARSSFVAASNTWYHLVGVYDYDAHLIKLYVNGVQEATADVSTSRLLATNKSYGRIRIGSDTSGDSTYQDATYGRVDEAAIWNRALTADEVGIIYQRSATDDLSYCD